MFDADVLMIWHAYMLHPHAYLEDCLRERRMTLWYCGMPWKVVNECIDDETFEYKPSLLASGLFSSRTGKAWDLLDDASVKYVPCPGCDMQVTVPWSTWVDPDFFASSDCCGSNITQATLAAGRFCADVRLLMNEHVYVKGTLLGTSRGLPHKVVVMEKEVRDESSEGMHFPNELLRRGLGTQLLNKREKRMAGENRIALTMDDIRKEIEERMNDKSYMLTLDIDRKSVFRAQRMFIRKMMSRYWQNPSPFSLELASRVRCGSPICLRRKNARPELSHAATPRVHGTRSGTACDQTGLDEIPALLHSFTR